MASNDDKPRKKTDSRFSYKKKSGDSGMDSKKPRRAKKEVYGESSLLRVGIIGAAWVFAALVLFMGYCTLTLPDIADAAAFKRKPSVTVLDASGSVLAEYGERTADPVTLDDVPPHLVNALLAVEDRRFYTHFGFDPFGFMRGAVVNPILGKRVTGGSTITQQLAKNLFLTAERTLKRKVQELLLSFWLEYKYSKKEILEAYLNRVYFGAGAYGIEAAARTYFGKSAKRLNIRESAMLMGLLKAPSRYSPKNNIDEANARTDTVIGAMKEAELLTDKEEKELTKLGPITENELKINSEGRYFSDWVLFQTQALMGDVAADVVVRTTLDRNVQRAAEETIKNILDADGEKLKASQAAALLMGRDGAIHAMVGGRDYAKSQFNRAVQSLRQPGSSFKPFIYLAALKSGLSPEIMFVDEPQKYGKWRPGNYTGKYLGPISMRQALTESINTVAVQVLDQVGVDPVIDIAHRMGITSTIPRELSIALGTSVVTMMELTSAYAVIANEGRGVAPYAISEIRDTEGNVLYKHRAVQMPQLVDRKPVQYLTSMMMDVVRKGTGQAAAMGREVAGKTGTSSDYRDAWFIGFTGNQTLGVWVGNDDNSQMAKVTGGNLPARIWRSIMTVAERGYEPRGLSTPPTLFENPLLSIFGSSDESDTAEPADEAVVDNSVASEEAPAEEKAESFGVLLNKLVTPGEAPQAAERPAEEPADEE